MMSNGCWIEIITRVLADCKKRGLTAPTTIDLIAARLEVELSNYNLGDDFGLAWVCATGRDSTK